MSRNIGVKKESRVLIDSQEGKTKFFEGTQYSKPLTFEEVVVQLKSKKTS